MKILSEEALRKWFYASLAVTFGIKLILAAIIPIVSDEAYFVIWAENLDFGYYDHPPVVAWMIAIMLFLGKTELIVRFPAVLLSLVMGWSIFILLKRYDRKKAYLIAIFFLVSPVNLLNVFITTDTPLIFFSFLSGVFLFLGVREQRYSWYALAGACLGLAFLSKYFAGLLGISVFFYFLLTKKEKKKLLGFLLFSLCTLPFILLNFYWNYLNCWDNILFNFFNRHEGQEIAFDKMLTYLVMMVYLLSPPVLFYLIKNKAWLMRGKLLQQRGFQVFLFLVAVPISFFLPVSLKTVIGIHWVFGYLPFFYLLLCLFLREEQLVFSIKFAQYFSLLHLVLVLSILYAPLERWIDPELDRERIYWKYADEIVKEIEPYRDQFHLASFTYSVSAMSSFHLDRHFYVFDNITKMARQDDIISDYKSLDGKNFLILVNRKGNLVDYQDYFDRIEVKEIQSHGHTFYYVLGYSFHYETYRQQVMEQVKERFYQIPEYLPVGQCRFLELNFP